MEHALDNVIWNAILRDEKRLSFNDGKVGWFFENVGPFVGMHKFSKANFNRLYSQLPHARIVALFSPDPLAMPGGGSVIESDVLYQMVHEGSRDIASDDSQGITALDDRYLDQMKELTHLTKPGPFYSNTISFGNYIGIVENGRLAAMAGFRLHAANYREVSAVCTHPDFAGKGYAGRLVKALVSIILENDEIPFLHVRKSNLIAIGLYKKLGFKVRREIFLYVISIKNVFQV